MKAHGLDLAQVREMIALQREWQKDRARDAYVAAMAALKRENLTIEKDKTVDYTPVGKPRVLYDHASIGNVVEVIVNAAARYGFSHRWIPDQSHPGIIRVTCEVMHELGHAEMTTLEGAPDQTGGKNAIQAVASTLSYLQRYTLLGAFGLATKDQEDDDGAQGKKPLGATREHEPTPEEIERESLRVSRENEWITCIEGIQDLVTMSMRKAECVTAYGHKDRVPQRLKDAFAKRVEKLTDVGGAER